MSYGVDVGALRIDDWDKLLLSEVAHTVSTGTIVSVLEIGCGAGAQAVRLAEAGAVVDAIDIADYKKDVFRRAQSSGVSDRVTFTQADMRLFLEEKVSSSLYTFASIQRVFHYVPYDDAKKFLERLRLCTQQALYLSVTGTTTAIAKYYVQKNEPLLLRWGMLDKEGQQVFSIHEPLCLYSEAEILELLTETGWEVIRHRVSDFGNIKIVARPHMS